MITIEQLKQLAPNTSNLADFVAPLNETAGKFGIASVRQRSAFLAQLVHESNGFRTLAENLNYSPAGLLATWPSRFTAADAQKYGRTDAHAADQKSIASIAYASRMGNGAKDSGDGWRYRGRGPIQITGKTNYTACGAALGIDLVNNPDLLLRPREGCLAAGWYWAKGNPLGVSLNLLAETGQIDAVSKAINGGDLGEAARRSLYEQSLKVLA